MRPNNDSIIASGTSTSGSVNSAPQWTQTIVRTSFQVVTLGNASGTLQVQVSNDVPVGKFPGQYVPTNWSNLGSSQAVTGAQTILFTEIECSYEYMRIAFTDGSGGTSTGSFSSARMKSMAL